MLPDDDGVVVDVQPLALSTGIGVPTPFKVVYTTHTICEPTSFCMYRTLVSQEYKPDRSKSDQMIAPARILSFNVIRIF